MSKEQKTTTNDSKRKHVIKIIISKDESISESSSQEFYKKLSSEEYGKLGLYRYGNKEIKLYIGQKNPIFPQQFLP